jgi:hypothetical protein
VEISIANEQVPDGFAVRVQVKISGREASRLFLAGDTLIQLPLEGALPDTAANPIPRVNIFLSELVGAREGLTRLFQDALSAERFAAAVRSQLETALEAS